MDPLHPWDHDYFYINAGIGLLTDRFRSAGLFALLVDLLRPAVAATWAPTDMADALKTAPADPRSSSYYQCFVNNPIYQSVQVTWIVVIPLFEIRPK